MNEEGKRKKVVPAFLLFRVQVFRERMTDKQRKIESTKTGKEKAVHASYFSGLGFQ